MRRFRRPAWVWILLLSTAFLCAQREPFAGLRRLSDVPIIAPRGNGWEAAGTFNPAVVEHGGKIVMLYRAQDKHGTSRLGYAESTDGIQFSRRDEPVLSPETDYEKDGGVEDPRLVGFGDTYYLTYTGYNKNDAQLCLATSKDLIHWDRKGIILPANQGNWNVKWTKSGAIVPEKLNGKYWMYFLGTSADGKDQTGVASSPDLLHWTEESKTRCCRPVRDTSIRASRSLVLRRLLSRVGVAASFCTTTVRMTSWCIAQERPGSTGRIRAGYWREATNRSLLPRRTGRGSARCPTWFSSKA